MKIKRIQIKNKKKKEKVKKVKKFKKKIIGYKYVMYSYFFLFLINQKR